MRLDSLFRSALAAVLLWCCATVHAEQYTVPLFVTASPGGDPQGVLRLVSDAETAATVAIHAIDDNGARIGPVTLTMNALTAVELSAMELESGNAAKGLSAGLGDLSGEVRLSIDSDVPVVPAVYVRAPDGALSAMNATVLGAAGAGREAYRYDVTLFNPASDAVQQSRLRLINPGDAAASITIEGRDDRGAVATGGTVELTLAASAARTLTAMQLEAGATGLAGRLGAIVGRWRLTVSSDRPIQVINTVASAYGYINNLSTTAVAGSAPANHDAFNARFVGSQIAFRTDSGDFTFAPGAGDTFTVTAERDGAATSRTGRYGYTALGADAGRVTRSYDDALRCEANLYFATITGGWFASFCTDTDDPDGYWVGGEWSVPDDAGGGQGGSGPDTSPDGGGGGAPGSLGACQVGMSLNSGQSCTYPGTSEEFSVNARGRGSFLGRLAGIRIRIDNETIDGREYDFEASHQGDGVWRIDRVAGSTEPPGGGTEDSVPSFAAGAEPDNQTYTLGTAIDTLTLPAASGGDGPLTYSLTPNVPGLSFEPVTRQLSGTPSIAASYNMTYTVTDEDGNVDALTFAIAVEVAVDGGSVAGDFDLNSANENATGIVFANGRFYVVDYRDRKVYAYTAPGQHDAAADFDLDPNNGAPSGIAFANGRFYIVDSDVDKKWTEVDKVYSYTASGQRDAAADFDLDSYNDNPGGIVFANGRFYVVGSDADKVFAYTASGERNAAADFDLDRDGLSGIAYANGRFYFVDYWDEKVYAYTASGQRDAAADFFVDGPSARIAYANGRFYVVDTSDDKVYAYTESGERAPGDDSSAGMPDLAVRSVSVSDSAPSPGASFTLSATVRNDGYGEAPATTLRYFRSTDPIISASDTEIGSAPVGGLSGGATINESISLTAPGESDCYYCGACVDTVDGESSTSNNCSNSVLIAVGKQTDLAISDSRLDLPSAGIEGSRIHMYVDVTNRGQVASPPSKLDFGYSSLDIPALAPGERMRFREWVGTVRVGTSTYTACIDFPCDSNPQNNCRSESVTYTY